MGRRRRTRRWGAVLVLGAGMGLVGGLMHQPRATATSAEQGAAPVPARVVRVARVRHASLSQSWKGHGAVRAGEQASLAFAVPGRLRERRVDVGDHVERGQILARLDTRAYRHATRAAEAQLAQASAQRERHGRDLARLSKLGDANAVPRQQVDGVESASLSSQAAEQAASVAVDEASRQLGEGVLRAPFSGSVAAVLLEPGELAAEGRPVVVLTGRAQREVQLEVPVSTARRLKSGARAQLRFPLAGYAPQAGVIESVGSAVSGAAGLVPVVVRLVDALAAPDAPDASVSDDAAVVPGTAVQVQIPMVGPAVLSVPAAAVVDPTGQTPAVLRVQGDRVQRVPVRVDRLVADEVVVFGDLAGGDAVVISGYAALRDGDAIRVQP